MAAQGGSRRSIKSVVWWMPSWLDVCVPVMVCCSVSTYVNKPGHCSTKINKTTKQLEMESVSITAKMPLNHDSKEWEDDQSSMSGQMMTHIVEYSFHDSKVKGSNIFLVIWIAVYVWRISVNLSELCRENSSPQSSCLDIITQSDTEHLDISIGTISAPDPIHLTIK